MGTLEGHISMCKVLRTVPVTEQVLWDATLTWTGSWSGSRCGNIEYCLSDEAIPGRRGQDK